MTDQTSTTPALTLVGRRPVLCGAAALCVTAVGGCAGYGKGRPPAPAAEPGNPAPASAGGTAAAAGAAAGTAVAKVADIPIGGGTILADRQLVVTRPSASEVRVLSAVCTHQGCLVDSVANGTISCPCHGSAFSLTGDVTSGPATRPLPTKAFTVVDGVVTA
jgi:Rieske Fe-S protein